MLICGEQKTSSPVQRFGEEYINTMPSKLLFSPFKTKFFSLIDNQLILHNILNCLINNNWLDEVKKTIRVLCDKMTPVRLNGKFCKTPAGHAILYGSEVRQKTKKRAKKSVTDIIILRWLS